MPRKSAPKPRWTERDDEILIELFDHGWSNKDIAAYIDRTVSSVNHRLRLHMLKRTKEVKCKNVLEGKHKHASEMPTERAESLIEPFDEDIRTDVRAEVEIPLTGLLQNGGNLEDVLSRIIEEAVYRGVRRALNE